MLTMGLMGQIVNIKELPIFLLVEKSEESGKKSESFELLEEIIKELSALEEKMSGWERVEIKIGSYLFSKEKEFCHPEKLVSLSEFDISEVFNDNVVDLTEVLTKFCNDLSNKALLSGPLPHCIPGVIFLLDGRNKYIGKVAAEQLKNNRWFQKASRMAFVFHEHKNTQGDILSDLVRSEKAIVKIENVREAIGIFKKAVEDKVFREESSIVFVDPPEEDDWGDNWD